MKCIRIVWGHPSPGPETHTKGNGPVTNTFCINTTPMFMASTIQQSEYCIIVYGINSSCRGLRRFSKWLCRSVPAALFTHFAANMTLYDHCWMSEVGRFFTCIWVLCICVFCISIRVIVQIILCPVHPLNTAPGIAENNWRAAADMRLASAFFQSSRMPFSFFGLHFILYTLMLVFGNTIWILWCIFRVIQVT